MPQNVKDIIEGYRDDAGVRHFTNQGAPAGVTVEQRWEAPRPEPMDQSRRFLDEALDYDVVGAAMADFSRHKDGLLRHTFGGTVNDERMLNDKQQAVWRKNANKLFALLVNQHQAKRQAMLQRYEQMAADAQARKADAAPAKLSDTDRLRRAMEEMMGLQQVIGNPAADAKAKAEAVAKYGQLYKQARFYAALSGKDQPRQMTPEQVQTVQDTAAATWGQLSDAEKAEYEGGFNEYMQEALYQAHKIMSGPSLLDQAGLPEPETLTGAGAPAEGGSAEVARRLPGVLEVLRGMPEAQRQQVGQQIDAAAAEAKRSGNVTDLLALMDQVAGGQGQGAPGERAPAEKPAATGQRAPQNISFEQFAAQNPRQVHANPVAELLRWGLEHPEEARRIAEERRRQLGQSFARRPPQARFATPLLQQ